MKKTYSRRTNQAALLLGLGTLFVTPSSVVGQDGVIGFTKGRPFSDGRVVGNTLYVAGQQGPDASGKFEGTDITSQTTNTIGAIEKIVKQAGFQMTDIVSVTVYVADLNDVAQMNVVYKKLMPDPKAARATVQVAGLIGGAKIEISAIAAKR